METVSYARVSELRDLFFQKWLQPSVTKYRTCRDFRTSVLASFLVAAPFFYLYSKAIDCGLQVFLTLPSAYCFAMRFSILIASALLTSATLAAPVTDDDAAALAQLDALAQLATDNQLATLSNATSSKKRGETCTGRNMVVRREW
jgi:hypothetical protein